MRRCSMFVAVLVSAGSAHADRTSTSVTASGDMSATDNVFATPRDVRESDLSFTLRPGILFGYDGPRASHEAAFEGEVLEFARHSEKPSVSARAGLRTRIQTTRYTSFAAQLEGQNGVLTALSSRSTPDATGPLVTPIGRIDTQSASGNLAFSWDTGRDMSLTETAFGRVSRSDDNADDTPGIEAPTIIKTAEAGGTIGIDRTFRRTNTIALEAGASVLRLERDAPATAMLGPRLDRQLDPRLRAQWRHDYNRQWSSTLDGGAVYVHPYGIDPDNPMIAKKDGVFPTFGGAVGYTEVWGRANLTARRDVQPNQLIAQNTLNDAATFTMAMPLGILDDSHLRAPKVVAQGSLGLSRTKLIDTETGGTDSAFYVARTDVGLGYSPRPGFTYGVRYEFQYQTGNKAAEMAIPGFWRQTLSFTFNIRYPNQVNGEGARRRTGGVRADGKDLVPIGVDPVSTELMRDDDPDQAGQSGSGSSDDDD